MDKQKFELLRNHTTALLQIKVESMGQKAIEISNSFIKYYNLYVDEYKTYQDMMTEKEKRYGELFNKFKFDNKLEARTKTEIEPCIRSDEGYYQICLRLNEQELVVKYLEGVCDAIKKLSYNIKNIIDMKNLGMQI